MKRVLAVLCIGKSDLRFRFSCLPSKRLVEDLNTFSRSDISRKTKRLWRLLCERYPRKLDSLSSNFISSSSWTKSTIHLSLRTSKDHPWSTKMYFFFSWNIAEKLSQNLRKRNDLSDISGSLLRNSDESSWNLMSLASSKKIYILCKKRAIVCSYSNRKAFLSPSFLLRELQKESILSLVTIAY